MPAEFILGLFCHPRLDPAEVERGWFFAEVRVDLPDCVGGVAQEVGVVDVGAPVGVTAFSRSVVVVHATRDAFLKFRDPVGSHGDGVRVASKKKKTSIFQDLNG